MEPAGRVSACGDSAKDALTWGKLPPTPERQSAYKHYALQEPGTITRHPGTARDAVHQGPFGSKPRASQESAAACLSAYPESELEKWKLEQKESVYASARTAPLGRGPASSHGNSGHLHESQDLKSTRKVSTYEDIFPPSHGRESDQFPGSERSQDPSRPGQPRSRSYDWAKMGINPSSHRFGATSKEPLVDDSVRTLLQPQLEHNAAQDPAPVSEAVVRRQLARGDVLGQPRALGAAPADRQSASTAFGRRQFKAAEPSVAELLREQSVEGTPRRDGCKHAAGRREGFPLAAGIACEAAAVHSAGQVAGARSGGGGEPGVGRLLSPARGAERGVGDEHLLALRSRGELQELLEGAGLALAGAEFEAVWAAAVEMDGARGGPGAMGEVGGDGDGGRAGGGRCCLATFMQARHWQLHQDAGLA